MNAKNNSKTRVALCETAYAADNHAVEQDTDTVHLETAYAAATLNALAFRSPPTCETAYAAVSLRACFRNLAVFCETAYSAAESHLEQVQFGLRNSLCGCEFVKRRGYSPRILETAYSAGNG